MNAVECITECSTCENAKELLLDSECSTKIKPFFFFFSILSETKTKVGNQHPLEAFTLEQKSKSWVNFLPSPEKQIFLNPEEGT